MRIINIPYWYFERVVSLKELVLFEILSKGALEIYSSDKITTILGDRFSCALLKVNYTSDFPAQKV